MNIKSLPSFASFKANLVKHSKYIDRISFGSRSTSTFKNTDYFTYLKMLFLLFYLLFAISVYVFAKINMHQL